MIPEGYVVVMFPESQGITEKEGFLSNCELINSDKGLEVYGSGAYLVDEDWYRKYKNGELADKEYTDDEMLLLDINYDEDWID